MHLLDVVIERWAYWRINGQPIGKPSDLLAERVQCGRVGSVMLCDDYIEQIVEGVFMDSMTDEQRLVMCIEYRANKCIPRFKNGMIAADALGMTYDCYKKALQKGRRLIGIKLNVI